jgi:putative copper resistance protein D
MTMVSSYVAHVLAGFAWVGALTIVCLAFRSCDDVRDQLAVFSNFGLALVGIIFATGCLNTAMHVMRASQLATTPYGQVLLVKIVLFALMLGLAAFNRREARRGASRHAVIVAVAIETTLGVLVLCAAAILGVTPPDV